MVVLVVVLALAVVAVLLTVSVVFLVVVLVVVLLTISVVLLVVEMLLFPLVLAGWVLSWPVVVLVGILLFSLVGEGDRPLVVLVSSLRVSVVFVYSGCSFYVEVYACIIVAFFVVATAITDNRMYKPAVFLAGIRSFLYYVSTYSGMVCRAFSKFISSCQPVLAGVLCSFDVVS